MKFNFLLALTILSVSSSSFANFRQTDEGKRKESQPQSLALNQLPVQPLNPQPVKTPEQNDEVLKRFHSIKDNEISGYISGFKIKKEKSGDETHLRFYGLIHPDCLPHLQLQLDYPSTEDDVAASGFLRFEKAEFISKTDPSKVLSKAEDNCSIEKTRSCNRESCIDIHKMTGLSGAESTPLIKTGPVLIKSDNLSLPEGHPEAVTFKQVPTMHGGPIEFKSAETISQEMQKLKEEERKEKIVSACEEAKNGNREAIDELKNLLQTKRNQDYSKLFEKLEARADEIGLREISDKLSKAQTIADMNSILEDAASYCKEHEKMKTQCVQFILSIGEAANNIDDSEASNSFMNSKLKFVEKTIRTASEIDPTNKNLKAGLYKAKFNRYEWAAQTGNDSFYNDQVSRESSKTLSSYARWAKKSNDPEVIRNYSKVEQKFTPQLMQTYAQTPYGPMLMPNYISNNDVNFINASQRLSFEEEMNAYRNRGLGSGQMNGPVPMSGPLGR